jgi:hypothetical protein
MSVSSKSGAAGADLQDIFQARMKSQCQAIERYRLAVERDEARVLSQDEAAQEWIERFAEVFVSK